MFYWIINLIYLVIIGVASTVYCCTYSSFSFNLVVSSAVSFIFQFWVVHTLFTYSLVLLMFYTINKATNFKNKLYVIYNLFIFMERHFFFHFNVPNIYFVSCNVPTPFTLIVYKVHTLKKPKKLIVAK